MHETSLAAKAETPQQAARRLSTPELAKGFKPVALHAYTDASGNTIYWRIRAKHPDTGEKWIRPMRRNGQGFEFGEPSFDGPKPLYALHRIASNPDAAIWIVEGEQKADKLNNLGLVATTSGGAASARAANWEPLRGRTVIIWPDNDDPGQSYAGEVADILRGMGCAVSCVDVDHLDLDVGGDVVDWLAAHPGAAGGDVEALPMLAHQPGPQGGQYRPVSLAALLALDLKQREMVLDGIIPERGLVMMHAPRGVGKTYVALSIGYAVAAGSGILRWHAPKARRVLIIDGEMPAVALQERFAAIVAGAGAEAAPDALQVLAADMLPEGLPDLATAEGCNALLPVIEGFDLVVLDNLSTLARSARENEAESWSATQDFLLCLRRRGQSALIIHHAGKSGAQRGTSRREDVLDTVIALKRPAEYAPERGAVFEVHFEKARGLTGAAVAPFEAALEIRDGALTWTTRDLEAAKAEIAERMYADSATPKDVSAALGVSLATAYRYRKHPVQL